MHTLASNEERIRSGTDFLAIVWSEIAAKVVAMAVDIYRVSPEQAAALRSGFLRRYTIVPV